jgi:hypothetical protein
VRITIVNLSREADAEVLPVVRAVNRQLVEDFTPYWDQLATLRLEGKSAARPDRDKAPELRGDAIIYLWGEADVEGALGYHRENNSGIPCGFVFTEIAAELGEPYSVILSHEAMELIGDANANKLAAGPHPEDPTRTVLHWYEMCDAVQAETYKIDGVDVSNFVLPLYFTPGEQLGGRNDFLGRAHRRPDGKQAMLTSFGVNPGGYVGFMDPATGQMDTWTARGDADAARRLEIKEKAGKTRRSVQKANLSELAIHPDLQSADAARGISLKFAART